MSTLILSPTEARRLAVTAQRLAGPRPPATLDGILEIFRTLHCVQIDPIRAVERTQLLVLWSRLGLFDAVLLDRLQQEERLIFEAWSHCASLVLMEDYPLFNHWMQSRAAKQTDGTQRVRAWMATNHELRTHILERLQAEGPLATVEFDDLAVEPWESSGWTQGRSVARMLDFLDARGELIVAGRRGNLKLWHLTDAWLPDWVDRSPLSVETVVCQSAQKALKALGVATQKQIKNHFIRGAYPNLAARIGELVAEGLVLPAQIVEEGTPWPGEWYIHRETLPVLESLRNGGWQPRTVLLSPFDNLICDRERTEQLFDFFYRIEIYVPKAKRQYGYYVLPILYGDRLIGRMDSQMDRKTSTYRIEAIYAESEAEVTPEIGEAIASTLCELATFLNAQKIALGASIPTAWREAIERSSFTGTTP